MILVLLPCLTIWRATACRVKKSPSALTAKTRSKLSLGDFKNGRQVEDSRVVDQDVDAVRAGDDSFDQPVDPFLLRHVERDGEGRLTEGGRRGPGLVDQDIGDRHAGALSSEPLRDRPADARGRRRYRPRPFLLRVRSFI